MEKIVALGPACFHMTVPESYRDANGHMNMRWYVAIFDEAGDAAYVRLGLTPDYHRARGTGTFDLEHHTHFLSEVLPGDNVAVYMRFAGSSVKRFHYLMFMVNESHGKLAAIFECVSSFVDLRIRKTAELPPEIAAKISEWVARDSQLDWPPPISGVMRV